MPSNFPEVDQLDADDETKAILRKLLQDGEIADIERAKKYNPWGKYDLSKTIFNGKYRDDIRGLVIDLHEAMHQHIDKTTPYGNLLIACRLLYKYSPTEKGKYGELLQLLQQESVKPHESLATWCSVSRVLNISEDYKVSDIIENRAYFYYYKVCDELLEGIPGFLNKNAVLLACINFCFSTQIMQRALTNLRSFSFSELNPLDYPNERWIRITEDFKSGALKKIFGQFVQEQSSLPYYENLKSVLSGEFIDNPSDVLGLFQCYNELGVYYYEIFNQHFKGLGTLSMTHNSEYNMPVELKTCLNEMIGFSYYKFHDKVYPFERQLALEYEAENVILNETPEKARIFFWEDLSEEVKKLIYEEKNEPDIWQKDLAFVLMLRHTKWLQDQFEFEKSDNVQWLREQNGPICYLSTWMYENGERIILIIVFRKTEDCVAFYEGKPAYMAIYACVFIHILAEDEFLEIWNPLINSIADKLIEYNDISLLYLLDKNFYFTNAKVTYCQSEGIINGDTSCTAIICKVEPEGFKIRFVMTPCNRYYAILVMNHLRNNFLEYQYDEEATMLHSKEQNGPAISAILKRVYMEHSLTPKSFLISEPY